MGLHLRYTTAATAGAALLGLAVYAVFKSGALRPVLVGAIRGGVKAADWVGDTVSCAKKNVEGMVAEAKAGQAKSVAQAKPVVKTAPKPAAKPAAKKPVAKPASKPVTKPVAKPAG